MPKGTKRPTYFIAEEQGVDSEDVPALHLHKAFLPASARAMPQGFYCNEIEDKLEMSLVYYFMDIEDFITLKETIVSHTTLPDFERLSESLDGVTDYNILKSNLPIPDARKVLRDLVQAQSHNEIYDILDGQGSARGKTHDISSLKFPVKTLFTAEFDGYDMKIAPSRNMPEWTRECHLDDLQQSEIYDYYLKPALRAYPYLGRNQSGVVVGFREREITPEPKDLLDRFNLATVYVGVVPTPNGFNFGVYELSEGRFTPHLGSEFKKLLKRKKI
ncbi:MAG: hypothetical protein GOV00_01300 [Candidatus Altiarchaeota archaeon]|nr:hypothetical protein [Candidatus Altiarchaeota archaeon]